MNPYALFDFVSIIFAVYLGAYVYSRNTNNILNRIFLVISLIFAYTAFCEYFRLTAPDYATAKLWHKISAFWPYIPVLFLKFVLEFTGNKLKDNKKLNTFLIIFPAVLSGLHIFTDELYTNLVHHYYGWRFGEPENWASAFVATFFLIIGIVSVILIIRFYFHQVQTRKKKEALFAIIGLSIPVMSGVVFEGVFQRMGINLPPINSITTIIGMGFLSISILRFKYFTSDPQETIQRLFATINDYLIVINEKGQIVSVSNSFLAYTNYKENELLEKGISLFIKSSGGEHEPGFFKKTGTEIESVILTKENGTIPISCVFSPVHNNNSHETLYLMLGRDLRERKRIENELLQMQKGLEEKVFQRTAEFTRLNEELKEEITERLIAEEALKESENRYRTVVENAKEIIYILGKDGYVIFANEAAIETSGYTVEEINKVHYFNTIPPEYRDTVKRFYLRQYVDKTRNTYFEFPYYTKNGDLLWWGQNVSAIHENGKFVGFQVIARDITATKRAEEALIKSEEFYRGMVENINEIYYLADNNGRITYASQNLSTYIGYTPAEVLGKSYIRFIHPRDRIKVSTHYQRCSLEGIVDTSFEFRSIKKDGSYYWAEQITRIVRDNSGKIIQYRNVLRNITDRKKTEKALRDSENKYRSIFDYAPIGIYQSFTDGRIRIANNTFAQILGYGSIEEVFTVNMNDIYFEKGKREYLLNHTELPWLGMTTEVLWKKKDGSPIWIQLSKHTIRNKSGYIQYFEGYIIDISDKKTAEENLKKSEERYKNLFENSPIGIYRTTPNGRILMANPAIWKMLQYDSLEELQHINLEEYGFASQTFARELFKSKIEATGIITGMESIWICKDGSPITVRESARCIYDEEHKPLFYEGTVEDITDQVKALEALRESEEKFRNLAEQSPNIIFIFREGRILYVNEKCQEVLGYDREYLTSPEFDISKSIDLELRTDSTKAILNPEENETPSVVEFAVHSATGKKLEVVANIREILYQGKRSILGILTDITERIEAEKALKESEERYRSLIENINEIYYVTDSTGRIIYVSSNAASFTGYNAEELMQTKILSYLYKADGKKVVEYFKKLIDEGQIDANIDFRAVKKDGTTFWVEQISRIIYDENGNVVEFRNVVRDITERKMAEEKVQLLAEAVRSSGEGISITDLNNNLLFVNEAFTNIYGYDESELIGKNISIVRLPDDDDPVADEIRLATVYKGWAGEILNMKKDGTVFPIFLSTSAVVDDQDEPYALVGVSRDITERKKTEKALIESEERYRNIFENTSVVMLLIDPADGSIRDANNAACSYYGFNHEWFLSQNISDLTADATDWDHILEDLNSEQIKEINCSHVLSSGEIRNVEIHSGNIKIKDETLLFSIVFDTTERRLAEKQLEKYSTHLENLVQERTKKLDKVNLRLKQEIEKLKTAEERIQNQVSFLQTLIDTIPNPVFFRDTNKVFTGCNTAFEKLHGLKKEDIIGKRISEIPSIKDATMIDERDDYLLLNPGEEKFEATIYDNNNIEREVLIFRATHKRADGSVGGIVGVIVDISEIKKLEKEILKALEKEKELNELKSRFISMASHEFRTPLTSILASADLLELYGRKWPEDKYYNYVGIIQKSVEYMTELINDVLTVSRSESGVIVFNPSENNLHELMKTIIDNLRLSAPDKINILFEYNMEEKVFDLDPKLLNQVFTNILSNAIKYSPKGGTVTVSVEREKECISITITDEGIGIPEEDQKRLFEPFHRAENVGTISGTGLGLSIAKKSVEIHHGTLSIKSQVNRGTQVLIKLNCPGQLQQSE